jgi:hypothetical protein
MDTNNRFTDADERRELLGYKYDPAEPLCKFGPGGDFVYCWPPKADMQPSSLTKMLNKLVPLVTSQPAQMPQTHEPEPAAKPAEQTHKIIESKGEFENAVNDNQGDKPTDAPPATIIKGDSLFTGQPLLFPDDSRACRTAKHKPKHRVRTHRRVAKKKPPQGLPGQGSLFETDFKSAKTA